MNKSSQVLFVPPGSGRKYNMGAMKSTFLADGQETNHQYSISEWWLDPFSDGPGLHLHDSNIEVFYVLKGVITFQVGDERIEASEGSFIRIPAGISHDFMNKSSDRAGLLNIFIPGGFEEMMPQIVQWYEDQGKTSGQGEEGKE